MILDVHAHVGRPIYAYRSEDFTNTDLDVGLGRTLTKGMYACRPPGMKHGPYRTEEGCVTFEVRYRL